MTIREGHSGNPLGYGVGRRNKTTIAVAVLLAGEARGVDPQSGRIGDPTAMLLRLERILSPCQAIETTDFERRLSAVETGYRENNATASTGHVEPPNGLCSL